jgi:hypothetical protein
MSTGAHGRSLAFNVRGFHSKTPLSSASTHMPGHAAIAYGVRDM